MFEITVPLIIGVVILAVFFCTLSFFVVRHAVSLKNKKSGDIWLFDNWEENIYDTLFKTQKPEKIAELLGVDVSKYFKNCKLCRKKIRLKKIVIDKIFGYIILIAFVIIGILTGGLSLIVIGLAISLPMIILPTYNVGNAVKKQKFIIADELPRFLDLLHTALYIDLPVDQAIETTANHLKETLIAQEFKLALAESKVGSTNWQTALEKLADNYEIDVLSDFVSDLINSYNNGTSIADSVMRKSKEIKRANLLTMKERASKLTSTILIPVLIFKIFPIIAILCVPVIEQLNSGVFGL